MWSSSKKTRKNGRKEKQSGTSDADIQVDNNGLHISTAGKLGKGDADIQIDENGVHVTTYTYYTDNDANLDLTLTTDVAQDVNQAINDSVDAIYEEVTDKDEQQVTRYQKKSSEWFVNFVLLLLIGLFGTKALIANTATEHANL